MLASQNAISSNKPTNMATVVPTISCAPRS